MRANSEALKEQQQRLEQQRLEQQRAAEELRQRAKPPPPSAPPQAPPEAKEERKKVKKKDAAPTQVAPGPVPKEAPPLIASALEFPTLGEAPPSFASPTDFPTLGGGEEQVMAPAESSGFWERPMRPVKVAGEPKAEPKAKAAQKQRLAVGRVILEWRNVKAERKGREEYGAQSELASYLSTTYLPSICI